MLSRLAFVNLKRVPTCQKAYRRITVSSEASTLYLSAFIDELSRAGLRHIVISPGSRSTPIAVLAAEHPNIKVWMNIDERSAGFFALGLAKAEQEAVALLCTSGTAAANYMPAVAEANLSRIPLVVLTADRPHELRDVGAPQTMDQIHLYGRHVKWFIDMPIPESSDGMIRHARTNATRAIASALCKPAGPVHLNFPLREPLLPNLSHPECFSIGRAEQVLNTNILQGNAVLSTSQVQQLADLLTSTPKGLIVCGAYEDSKFAEAVVRLGSKLSFPILADPLSQLRAGAHEKSNIIPSYDSFLRNEQVVEGLEPDIIIRIGAMPVSKSLTQYLSAYSCTHIVVDEGGWRDSTMLATYMITADPTQLCNDLYQVLSSSTDNVQSTSWLEHWQQLNKVTSDLLAQVASEDAEQLFEGRVITELQSLLPADSVLFVGNSMPIRDVDMFLGVQDRSIKVLANRGVNGIDGLVSTAMGISAAGHRTVLLLGDLSFYHDLNGLLAAKLHKLPITIIVVNNDGGGIFSFLPQATMPNHFEQLFGTPIGLDYRYAIQMYGGEYTKISNWNQFQQCFELASRADGLQVIEVPTDRQSNVALHRQIWPRLAQTLTPLLQDRGKKC